MARTVHRRAAALRRRAAARGVRLRALRADVQKRRWSRRSRAVLREEPGAACTARCICICIRVRADDLQLQRRGVSRRQAVGKGQCICFSSQQGGARFCVGGPRRRRAPAQAQAAPIALPRARDRRDRGANRQQSERRYGRDEAADRARRRTGRLPARQARCSALVERARFVARQNVQGSRPGCAPQTEHW